ncbi:MAG: hypothetical protein HC786_20465 [Richelia sp. CSU_2_1]|nr:hypothetical protein [Microcoleus sp. SU_5_3]NJR24351.1 hypothetical protein [Richelia sp. CSU_2_1]
MQGFAVHHDYRNDFNLPNRMPQAHSIVTPWGAEIECTLIGANTSDIQATSWSYQLKGANFSFHTICYGGLAGDPIKDLIVAFRAAVSKSYGEVRKYPVSDSWGNKKKFLYVYNNQVVGDSHQSAYEPPVWRDEKDREVFRESLLNFPESELSGKAKELLEKVKVALGLREKDISSRFREKEASLWILICSGGGAELDIDLATSLVKVSCRNILFDISLDEAIKHIRSIRISR